MRLYSPPWWLLLLVPPASLALRKAYSIDEFQYAHSAWLMAKGQVPYRDFFEVHLPLVYQALSPLFKIFGDAPQNVVALRAGMLLFVAVQVWALHWLNRESGSLASWLAPLFWVSSITALPLATEIRPDSASFAFYALALAAASSPLRPTRRGVLIGASVVLAVWGSQKALFHGAVFGIALLLDLRRPLPEKRLGSFRAVASGAALALLPIATWLTVERAWLPAWEWCFRWARDHQRGYPGFSFWRYFGPALTAEPLFFSLAVFGALGALVRWRDHGLLVAAWLLSFGSFALQRAPYPYSLLPFMGVSAALAARGAQAIWETFAPRPSLKRGAALTLALVLGLQHWRLLQLPGNAEQRKVQARIGELTRVTDAAYDNSGGYVTRPHAHFFFYTDAYLRTHWAQTLEDDVPRALLESECVLRVQDVRSDTLPPKLVQFLSENYQPVDGDLSLWGRRLSVTADGTFEGQFYAVKSDRYFVQPAEAQGGLRIDGLRVGPVFTLTRGWHSVRYRGSASELFLLWLPRNQERWMPTYGRAPHYSRLF